MHDVIECAVYCRRCLSKKASLKIKIKRNKLGYAFLLTHLLLCFPGTVRMKTCSFKTFLLLTTFIPFVCTSNLTDNGEVKSNLDIKNSSSTHSRHYDREIYESLLTTCFAITALVSLLGNGLVIHVVRTTPFMHTSVNMYIANMACSDVISTLVCTPLMIKQLSQYYYWLDGTQGLILCRLVFFFFYTSFACSTFNHVAIAIDRYLAVTKPMFRYSQRIIKIIIASIWITSSMLSIPIVDGYNLYSYKRDVDSICYDSVRDTVYDVGVTIMALMCFVIPLTVATILYSLTGYHLRQRSDMTIGCYSDNRKRQTTRSAYKAIKLMVTIIVVFTLCWSPFFVYHLAKAWYEGKIYRALKWYHRPLSFLLASANAAVNPCLYYIFNDNFRKGMNKVFKYLYRVKPVQESIEMRTSRTRTRTRSQVSDQ